MKIIQIRPNLRRYGPRNALSNISRSKANQKMIFCQLIAFKMKRIFPGKSYTKFVGQTSPSLFNKKSKWSISLDQQSEML